MRPVTLPCMRNVLVGAVERRPSHWCFLFWVVFEVAVKVSNWMPYAFIFSQRRKRYFPLLCAKKKKCRVGWNPKEETRTNHCSHQAIIIGHYEVSTKWHSSILCNISKQITPKWRREKKFIHQRAMAKADKYDILCFRWEKGKTWKVLSSCRQYLL